MAEERMSELVRTQGGMPTKCRPDVIKTVCDAIREGMSPSGAMRMAGVDPNCLYGSTGWIHRGERGEEPFRTFLEQATIATAQAEQRAVKALVKGFDKDWRAAAAWLARRMPMEWKERQSIDFTVDPGGGGTTDPMEAFRAELREVMSGITSPEELESS
jgi:hypothetical protein